MMSSEHLPTKGGRPPITEVIREKENAVIAEVTGRIYGYLGFVPGTLLRVETQEILKGAANRKSNFIHFPEGSFEVGDRRVCRTTLGFPSPPELGDRVLLLYNDIGVSTETEYLNVRARQFFEWTELQELDLRMLTSIHIAAYREVLMQHYKLSTVKLHLSGIRKMFDHLVERHVVTFNPVADVKTERLSRPRVLTPMIPRKALRILFDSFDTRHVVGLRDRAFSAVLFYGAARIGAVVAMRVRDYRSGANPPTFFFGKSKGGKEHLLPVHPVAADYLEAYLEAAGIQDELDSPLFRSTRSRSRHLNDRGLDERAASHMIKRRLRDAGLSKEFSPHSFRVAAGTTYIKAGGSLQEARKILNHADVRTTQAYIVDDEDVKKEEIFRINI